MKPVVLPMQHLPVLHLLSLHRLGPCEHREWRSWNVRLFTAVHAQHTFEFVRKDLDEAGSHVAPVVENPLGAAAGGQFKVAQQKISDDLYIRLLEQRLQINRVQITTPLGKISA